MIVCILVKWYNSRSSAGRIYFLRLENLNLNVRQTGWGLKVLLWPVHACIDLISSIVCVKSWYV